MYIFLYCFINKVLIWKTNFDASPPSIDSNNNKYANSTDYITTSRTSLVDQEKNRSQMAPLQAKSEPETRDERRARKVNLIKILFPINFIFSIKISFNRLSNLYLDRRA